MRRQSHVACRRRDRYAGTLLDRPSVILLAMDMVTHGGAVVAALEGVGWRVQVVPDAGGALEALFDGMPDLLVVAEPLPDAAGVELVDALRRMPGGDAPGVVVITRSPTGGDQTVDRWVHPSAPSGTLLDTVRQVALLRGVPVPSGSADTRSASHLYASPADAAPLADAEPPAWQERVVVPTEWIEERAAVRAEAAAHRASPEAGRAEPSVVVGVRAPVSDSGTVSGSIPPQMLTREARDRMTREVSVLEKGDPWAALGVPRRSARDLVERGAQRMEARYTPYLSVPDPIFRDLATRMLACVRDARDRVLAGAVDEPVAGPDLYARGNALLAEHRWAEADAFFSLMRQENSDSAVAMAGEGWARFNNPELPKEDREPDGVALMELAAQIDAGLADTQARLARIALREGRKDAARSRARLALRAEPRHPDASELLRSLGEAT